MCNYNDYTLAMSKIVLWVSDIKAQQDFYEKLLGVSNSYTTEGFCSVTHDSNSVLLHELPREHAAEVPLTHQLKVEEEVAIKPVFIVNSIDEAIQSIAETFATIQGSKSSYGSSTYQDIVDPEGNVIQIEELIK